MNAIQTMLEALKAPGTNFRQIQEAIALGEAELAREPVAWIARVPHPWGNDLGQIRQLSYEKSTDDAMPLYTREEIK